MKRLAAAGLLSLLMGLPLWGQVTSLHFNNLSIDAGLSDKQVFSIAQDRNGLMWFGTAEGLNRYDGYNFEVYRYNPEDATSISASYINYIHRSRTGDLWIGTEKGLNLYNPDTESFVKYHADNDSLLLLNNLRIRCIYDDPQNVLWVGTLEGLIRLDIKERYINFFVLAPNAFDRMANEIRCICADRYGMLWLGTFDGLYRFNPKDNSFTRYDTRSSLLNDQYNNLINSLYISPEAPDRLYVGSTSGLVVLDIRQPDKPFKTFRTESSALADNDIKSIINYDRTKLLIATANGLSLYDTLDDRIDTYNSSLTDATSLPDNSLRALFRDQQGVIWVGTDCGLAKLNLKRKKIDFVRLTSNRNGSERRIMVNDLLGEKDRSLWITTNDGVLRYDSLRKNPGYIRYSTDKGVSHNITKRLMRDSRGTLWLGTNDGIDYYDARSDRFIRADYTNQNFSLKYIYDIQEDCDGDIVTNISSGLCFITPHYHSDGSISHLSYKTRLISDIIKSDNCDIVYMDTDAKGNVWFATTHEGLFKYEKHRDVMVQYKARKNDPQSLISNRIYTIHIAPKGDIWVGSDRGLCKLDVTTGLFERFDNDLDLSQSIRTVTSDTQGRIWVATTNKLVMYDPSNKSKIVCDLNQDLRLDELIYNSYFIDNRGFIYMGGNGGFIRFHPDRILLNQMQAPMAITSFSLWNKELLPGQTVGKRVILRKSILQTSDIRLCHNENSFRINFSLLSFASSVNNKYAYRLEGYDKEWQMTGGIQNFASYSNLSPGRYTFIVRGCNTDGVWSDEVSSLEIRILAPWWLSWWAYLIYLLLLTLLIIIAYNLTITKMKLLSELKLEKLERMKMEELNQIKMRFFTNVSHEFKTPLSLILGPIESLSETIHDTKQLAQLALMRQNGERLLRLIDQIMDLRKFDNGKMKLSPSAGEFVGFARNICESFTFQAQRRHIDYDFETSEVEINLQFDSDKVEKVFYNLLSNAFKFTPDNGHIGIAVSLRRDDEHRHIVVEVSDTGVGITEADREHIFERFYQGSNPSFESIHGTGIGLMLAKDFVELHGGTLTLESTPGKGSTFTFTLPCDIATEQAISVTAHYPESESAERKPRILIVEDNEDMQSFIRMDLEEQYEVYTARDGDQGWEQIHNIDPDLIISDVMMPGMDGFELCRRIKVDLLTCHIPVVLLTAKGDEENRAEGYAVGADGYISKPFSIKTLRTRINKLIEQRIKLQERYRQKLLTDPSEVAVESENDKFIATLVQTIEQNMDNSEFGIQELCEISRYSYQQVYRKVKALTGESINEFIRSVRLKRAAQYLSRSDLRISEIMYSVGFNSHSYFTKCFREHFGLSPKEYAEQNRAK